MARDDQGFGFDPADTYIGRVDATERSKHVDEVCRRLERPAACVPVRRPGALVFEEASAVYRDPHDPTKPAKMLMVVPAIPDAMLQPVEKVSTVAAA